MITPRRDPVLRTRDILERHVWMRRPESTEVDIRTRHASIHPGTVKRVVALVSGGNDSSTFLHVVNRLGPIDEVLHVDTGIGIPETQEYVRAYCAHLGLPLRVVSTPLEKDTYTELVIRFGFPGPGGHPLVYRRLKERALYQARRDMVAEFGLNARKGDRVVFLAGMRRDESARRMRNASAFDPDGLVDWVSPIVYWTDEDMRRYRRRHGCQIDHRHADYFLCSPEVIGRSPVSDKLHMSGECLCGAFAKPGELDEIGFWYPEMKAKICALQELVAAHGQHAVWGTRPPRKSDGVVISNMEDARAVAAARVKLEAADARLCTRCVA